MTEHANHLQDAMWRPGVRALVPSCSAMTSARISVYRNKPAVNAGFPVTSTARRGAPPQ